MKPIAASLYVDDNDLVTDDNYSGGWGRSLSTV